MSVTTTENITGHIASSLQQRINIKSDALRSEALDAFLKTGLPSAKSEEYKHTPVTRHLEKNFTFNPSAASGPLKDVSQFLIPGLDAINIIFIDGVLSKEHSTLNGSGLRILPLEDAVANDKIVLDHFAKYANINSNPLVAWNTAGWNHGLFIDVPESSVVEKPVAIYHIINGTAGEVIALNRNLLVIGKNSQVTVVEKFGSSGDANHFTNLVTEIVVAENAGIDFYSVQNDNHNRYLHNVIEISQKNSSRVNTHTFTGDGKFYRNNLHLALDGEGIESHMFGLYLLDKETLADTHSVVDHKKPNSFSNELYKGVMDGSSKGVFNGKIFVRPNAQKTNAFQANRNILLTDKATINTKPQLEIWADDVKCSHGCTTGQLDEEAMFYLQARGINKDTARAMMLYAFAAEVFEAIKHPVLKAYFDEMVSNRLHKNF